MNTPQYVSCNKQYLQSALNSKPISIQNINVGGDPSTYGPSNRPISITRLGGNSRGNDNDNLLRTGGRDPVPSQLGGDGGRDRDDGNSMGSGLWEGGDDSLGPNRPDKMIILGGDDSSLAPQYRSSDRMNMPGGEGSLAPQYRSSDRMNMPGGEGSLAPQYRSSDRMIILERTEGGDRMPNNKPKVVGGDPSTWAPKKKPIISVDPMPKNLPRTGGPDPNPRTILGGDSSTWGP